MNLFIEGNFRTLKAVSVEMVFCGQKQQRGNFKSI